MIFVTVGTQDKQFRRLLNAIENSSIDEEVIIQSGNTKFESKKYNIKVYKFLSIVEFDEYMKKADQIIAHAGVGTIIHGLKLHKKMIIAPRLKKYKEHVNDHQVQILETFSKAGYILPLYNFDQISDMIKLPFKPKEFKSNNHEFNKQLNEEINKYL